MIWKARRLRKALGGGMRQTGLHHFNDFDHDEFDFDNDFDDFDFDDDFSFSPLSFDQ